MEKGIHNSYQFEFQDQTLNNEFHGEIKLTRDVEPTEFTPSTEAHIDATFLHNNLNQSITIKADIIKQSR